MAAKLRCEKKGDEEAQKRDSCRVLAGVSRRKEVSCAPHDTYESQVC
jgi:hypothetical protein